MPAIPTTLDPVALARAAILPILLDTSNRKMEERRLAMEAKDWRLARVLWIELIFDSCKTASSMSGKDIYMGDITNDVFAWAVSERYIIGDDPRRPRSWGSRALSLKELFLGHPEHRTAILEATAECIARRMTTITTTTTEN